MRKHVLYYFSGTGNSLKAALSIQKALENCDVVSMGTARGTAPELPDAALSIGFVFPCYFGGVPHRVQEFVLGMDLQPYDDTYIYAVATYGTLVGATLGQMDQLVRNQGATLSYAAALKSFANYVILYDMSPKVAQKTAETKAALAPIITQITQQKKIEIKKTSAFGLAYNRIGSKEVATEDRHFVVRESCSSCGICKQVCPVVNIELREGKPRWLGHCEQCLACLQWCPDKAIDYKDKTRNRGRYTHPEITLKMFISSMESTKEQ